MAETFRLRIFDKLPRILMMVQKSGYDELRLVVYPIRVVYIPGGFLAGCLSHQRFLSQVPGSQQKRVKPKSSPEFLDELYLPKTNIAPEKGTFPIGK